MIKLNTRDKNVRLIKFSRNFGKEAAILAGLEKSLGKAVVLMDADLQDPPYLIEQMYKIWINNGAKNYICKTRFKSWRKLYKIAFKLAFL